MESWYIMQWSKAKTYIILALIFTNTVLFFTTMHTKNFFDSGISSSNVENLNKVLTGIGVQNNAKIDTKQIEVHPLVVDFISEDSSHGDIFENINMKYHNNLKIIDEIYYEISLNCDDMKNIENKAKFAVKWLEDMFPGDEYKLKKYIRSDFGTTLSYEEFYAGYFVGRGYVNFSFNEDDSLEISILKVKKTFGVNKTTKAISSAQALALALSKLKKGDIINDISLGYDVPQNNEYVTDESKTRTIKMMPYWRIKVNYNDYIYIQAI